MAAADAGSTPKVVRVMKGVLQFGGGALSHEVELGGRRFRVTLTVFETETVNNGQDTIFLCRFHVVEQ